MQLTTFTSLIMGAAPAVAQAADWGFTAPDPSFRLDLSRNVTVEWEYRNPGNQTEYTELHIMMFAASPDPEDDGMSGTEVIAARIDPNAGEYAWAANGSWLYEIMNGTEGVHDGIDPDRLPQDIRLWFVGYLFTRARAPRANFATALNFTSEEYRVEGFPRESAEDESPASSTFVSLGSVLIAGTAAMMAWM